MPGHVEPTHVENALGPLLMDFGGVTVEPLDSVCGSMTIIRVRMDTGHIDEPAKYHFPLAPRSVSTAHTSRHSCAYQECPETAMSQLSVTPRIMMI